MRVRVVLGTQSVTEKQFVDSLIDARLFRLLCCSLCLPALICVTFSFPTKDCVLPSTLSIVPSLFPDVALRDFSHTFTTCGRGADFNSYCCCYFIKLKVINQLFITHNKRSLRQSSKVFMINTVIIHNTRLSTLHYSYLKS